MKYNSTKLNKEENPHVIGFCETFLDSENCNVDSNELIIDGYTNKNTRLSRKAPIIFPEFNIRLYDKNFESDYFFFPPPKSEYFFQQHWESEYFIQHCTEKIRLVGIELPDCFLFDVECLQTRANRVEMFKS
jgi:hypothetical protein